MPDGDEHPTTDEKVRRSVGRTLFYGLVALVVLGALGVWGSFGFYTVQPGQAVILLRLGSHAGTVTQPGPHITLPPPITLRETVSVSELRNEDFGIRGQETPETPRQKLLEGTMQTGDNNIVRVGFAVQFRIADAFAFRYRVGEPTSVVRDAAQAAMREVVGRETVDGVLRDRRALVTAEVAQLLQEILDSYESGIQIDKVQLQDVQPPPPVRAAFDDVVAATQDANRSVNEAEGYANEVLPRARAEATELIEAAQGYRDAKVAEATGEAERFKAIVVEYRKAPVVTQKRLYLETMEIVLPDVEKVIVEPGTTQLLPYLPLGDGRRPQ